MTVHHEYCRHRIPCRMQDPAFRARYIDTIPPGAPLPYPIAELDRAAEGGPAEASFAG